MRFDSAIQDLYRAVNKATQAPWKEKKRAQAKREKFINWIQRNAEAIKATTQKGIEEGERQWRLVLETPTEREPLAPWGWKPIEFASVKHLWPDKKNEVKSVTAQTDPFTGVEYIKFEAAHPGYSNTRYFMLAKGHGWITRNDDAMFSVEFLPIADYDDHFMRDRYNLAALTLRPRLKFGVYIFLRPPDDIQIKRAKKEKVTFSPNGLYIVGPGDYKTMQKAADYLDHTIRGMWSRVYFFPIISSWDDEVQRVKATVAEWKEHKENASFATYTSSPEDVSTIR